MSANIILKRSAVAGRIPTTDQLELGEVAINTADGKMYIKKITGGVESIVVINGAPEGVWKQYYFTATEGQSTFSGIDDNSKILGYTINFLEVYLNGILLDPVVDYVANTGYSIEFAEPLTVDDVVQIDTFSTKIGPGDIVVDTFTGDNTTASFQLTTDPGSENNIFIYIDGVYQEKDTYTVSGETLVFGTAPYAGASIEAIIGSRNLTITDINDLTISGDLSVAGNVGAANYSGTSATLTNQLSSGSISTGTITATGAFSSNSNITTTADTSTNNLAVTNNVTVTHDVSAESVTLTNSPGSISYNTITESYDFPLNSDVVLQVGEENVIRGKATEAISNGEVVMFAGAQGDHLLLAKANFAAVGFRPEWVVGIATQDIAINDFGYVTSFGNVHGLNTSTLSEGDILYADPSTPGALTTTRPISPNHVVQMAAVLSSNPAEGVIIVRPSHFPDTDEVLEGQANLYYTDARVGSYLSTNGYDTTSNIIATITDSAPTTLDTLNELAAALGDDPNFATTVSTQIGTKWTQDNTKISNWDTAYGWGNHASAGYAAASSLGSYLPLAQARKTYKGTATINNSGYTTIATVTGDRLGSAVELVVNGTSNSVVINVSAKILVNHSQDIFVTSTSGIYTQLNIKITSNSNETFAIELQRTSNTGEGTEIAFEITDLSTDSVTLTSSHSISGTTHTHTTYPGTNHTATGGSTHTIRTDGVLVASGYNSSNWDTAYGWGNHASAGYLTSLPSHSHSNYTPYSTSGSYPYFATGNWIRMPGDGLGILPYSNGNSYVGTSSWRFGQGWINSLNGGTPWTSANDGSGSGLDADTVDGIQGGSLLRSDATDYKTGVLYMRDDIVVETGYRNRGVFGSYDSTKTQHIWSMGTAYRNHVSGTNFGNLYGLAYKHTNNGTGGTMAGGHQMVWCQNGSPKAAMGTGIWTSGSVYGAAFYYNSDRAFKENIEPLTDSIETISKLQGVRYTLKSTQRASIGFIAQDVEEVLPEFVEGEEGEKKVNYAQMVALFAEAIKEQQKQINELKQEIELLKK